MCKNFTAIEFNAFFNRQNQLTKQEEQETIAAIAEGNKEARDKLVLSNLKYAGFVASRISFSAMEFDDLYNECVVGLIVAANHIKKEFNNKFITYANFWIKSTVNYANNNSGKNFRISDEKYKQLTQVSAIYKKYMLCGEYTYNEVIDKVTKEVDLPIDYVKELLTISQPILSLDSFSKNDKSDGSVEDIDINNILEDKKQNFEEDIINSELEKGILKIVKRLPEREADVLIKHFGLNGTTPMSFSEIGKFYGYSKGWANDIEKKAREKLLAYYGDELEQYIA